MNSQSATSAGQPALDPFDVIVAEDDAHDQMLLVMAAKDSGASIEFSFVGDGVELLEVLRARRAAERLPDFVVLDMRMPRLSGHEVLDALADEPEIRPAAVGVFSSSHRQQDIDASLAKGALWHETKPSKFDELAAFVQLVVSECEAVSGRLETS